MQGCINKNMNNAKYNQKITGKEKYNRKYL